MNKESIDAAIRQFHAAGDEPVVVTTQINRRIEADFLEPQDRPDCYLYSAGVSTYNLKVLLEDGGTIDAYTFKTERREQMEKQAQQEQQDSRQDDQQSERGHVTA